MNHDQQSITVSVPCQETPTHVDLSPINRQRLHAACWILIDWLLEANRTQQNQPNADKEGQHGSR